MVASAQRCTSKTALRGQRPQCRRGTESKTGLDAGASGRLSSRRSHGRVRSGICTLDESARVLSLCACVTAGHARQTRRLPASLVYICGACGAQQTHTNTPAGGESRARFCWICGAPSACCKSRSNIAVRSRQAARSRAPPPRSPLTKVGDVAPCAPF